MISQAEKRLGGKLKCLLRERSQFEKTTYWTIATIWLFGREKIIETVKRSMLARGCIGEGRRKR